MRIIISTDNYYPNVNGASYFAQRLAYQLKAAQHEVLVIAPSRKIINEEFEHEGVKIFGAASFPLERIRTPWPIIIYPGIRRAIKKFQPDIVHIQSHFSIARKSTRIAKKLGLPVVGTNHFMPENLFHFLPLPKSSWGLVKKLAWKYFTKTFNLLEAVTSPTQTAANLLVNIGLNKQVLPISNGIDLKLFNKNNNGENLKLKYKLDDRPVLLFVGRLDQEKYLDLVIETFARVVKKVPVQLVIAGIGAEEANLKTLTKELNLENDVIFTGFVLDEELPNLYALAKVFIMAGTAELQSIVTMEAMATGLPIIAVRAMALPELVHDQENGFLFEHGDVDAMAEKIICLFTDNDLYKKMSQKSLELITRHDIVKVTDDFVNLYSSVINKHDIK